MVTEILHWNSGAKDDLMGLSVAESVKLFFHFRESRHHN